MRVLALIKFAALCPAVHRAVEVNNLVVFVILPADEEVLHTHVLDEFDYSHLRVPLSFVGEANGEVSSNFSAAHAHDPGDLFP